MHLPNKFILIWDDFPVGVGGDGYPFKTTYPTAVMYWKTREEAQKYADTFKSSNNNWTVKEIEFRIVDKT